MSIATKTGDAGTTGLMFNRRVSKCHPRVEACGTVDELNSSLGLAKAAATMADLQRVLEGIQKDLVPLMGELATLEPDLPAYLKGGFARIETAQIDKLDKLVHELEKEEGNFAGWARPGANLASAALDLARTVCRRAERIVCALAEAKQIENPNILIYLNRLADILWLLARKAEHGNPLGS